MKDFVNKYTNKFLRDIRFKLFLDVKLRKKILQRDNYTCCLCGYEENRFIKKSKSLKKVDDNSLEIHHIISLGNLDEDELLDLAFDEDNMITLCKNCHRYIVTGNSKKYIDFFREKIEETK